MSLNSLLTEYRYIEVAFKSPLTLILLHKKD